MTVTNVAMTARRRHVGSAGEATTFARSTAMTTARSGATAPAYPTACLLHGPRTTNWHATLYQNSAATNASPGDRARAARWRSAHAASMANSINQSAYRLPKNTRLRPSCASRPLVVVPHEASKYSDRLPNSAASSKSENHAWYPRGSTSRCSTGTYARSFRCVGSAAKKTTGKATAIATRPARRRHEGARHIRYASANGTDGQQLGFKRKRSEKHNIA